jgi:hypothetical protein
LETGVQEFIPVPLSHLAGVMTALFFFVLERNTGTRGITPVPGLTRNRIFTEEKGE